MAPDPANTPDRSIWPQQMVNARPNTIINTTNHNKHERKLRMPTPPTPTPNIKSSKSQSSDIANSPCNRSDRSGMKGRIINYIRAGYPGLYLVSHEEQRVHAEMTQIAKELKYSLFFWSVVDGLIDTQKGTNNSANDPLEALIAINDLKEE